MDRPPDRRVRLGCRWPDGAARVLVTLPHEDFVYLGDGARLPYGPAPARRDPPLRARDRAASSRRRASSSSSPPATRRPRPRCPTSSAASRAGRRRDRARGARRRAGDAQPARSACSRRRRPSRAAATRRSCATLDAGVRLIAVACPRLVPLIEGDDPFGEETVAAVREYAAPLKRGGGRHRHPRLHPLPADPADPPARLRP